MNLRTRQMIVGLIGFFFFLLCSVVVTVEFEKNYFYWIWKSCFLILEGICFILIVKSVSKE